MPLGRGFLPGRGPSRDRHAGELHIDVPVGSGPSPKKPDAGRRGEIHEIAMGSGLCWSERRAGSGNPSRGSNRQGPESHGAELVLPVHVLVLTYDGDCVIDILPPMAEASPERSGSRPALPNPPP